MVPVTQTRFGFPEGNCTEAALASVLEIDLDSVPDLKDTDPDGNEWVEVINEWMVPTHGLYLACFGTDWGGAPFPPAWVLLGGLGPRGLQHMVVGFGGEVRHDPHPDQAGLVEPNLICLFVAVGVSGSNLRAVGESEDAFDASTP